MAEIVHIVHLTLPTSLHYLVERRCSKLLRNTGFITTMLRFGVKVKRAYCCDNFFAWRPLPDIRSCLETIIVFHYDGAPVHRARDAVAFLERE